MKKRGTSERDNGEYEFTRAAHDVAKDTAQTWGLEEVMLVSFDKQRGVLDVTVAFWDNDVNAYQAQPVRVTSSWPNANGATWGAFLYQQWNKACIMADAWGKEREAQLVKKP